MATEIRGRLDPTRLGEILDLLREGDRTWSLLVSDGTAEKIFYFSIGGIRMVAHGGGSARTPADILSEQGGLAAGARRGVEERMAASGRPFAEVARELEAVPREALEAACRQQLLEEAFDLFLWEDAEVEFIEGQPSPKFYDTRERACSASCDVPEFVGALRERYAAWQSVEGQVGGGQEALCLTESGRQAVEAGLPGARGALLALVDGHRTATEAIRASGLPALPACEALVGLLQDRLVRRAAAAAAGPRDRESLLAEVRALEKARTEMIGDLIVRKRLVRAYVELGEREKAVQVLREVARLHQKRGDLRAMLDALRHLTKLSPEDFNAREQIVGLLRGLGETAKMLEEGRSLAESLFKQNLLNRARRTIEKLLAVVPDDVPLRRLHALTLIGMGLTDLALHGLRSLAGLLERTNAPEAERREVYRRILALDGHEKETRRKLRALSVSRRAMILTRLGVALSALLVLFGVGSFLYESSARRTVEAEQKTIMQLVGERRYEAARVRARALRSRYPLSFADRRASDFLNRIDAEEAEYLRVGLRTEMAEAERAERAGDATRAGEIYRRIAQLEGEKDPLVSAARERLARLAAAEKGAEELVARAEALAGLGRYEEAIRIYDEVRSLYPLAAATARIRYPSAVSSLPPGARVFLNGEEIPDGPPARIAYSLLAKNRLRLELPGFEPLVLDIEAPLPPRAVLPLRKQTRWVFQGEGPFEGAPAVADGRVYVAGRDQYLTCLDAATGSVGYRVSLGLFGDSGVSVAIAGANVVVGTGRGELVAVDAATGEVRWRRMLGGAITADLAADPVRGRIYANEGGGGVFAVDASSGAVLWSAGPAAAPASAPVLAGEFVLVGSSDRRCLSALRASDGVEAWSHVAAAPVSGSPSVAGLAVLLGTDDGAVWEIDVGSRLGQTLFRAEAAVKAAPVRDGNGVIAGGVDGKLHRRRPDGGTEEGAWTVDLGAAVAGAPLVSGDSVYAVTAGGRLCCVDRRKGTLRWVFATEGEGCPAAAVAAGTVFLASPDGRLYAIAE